MINRRIERFIIQLILSILIGGLFSAISYVIYKQTGVTIEIGSVISKSLSVISAILIGFLVKRYIDNQDKIKDIELNSNAPKAVVELFDSQKEEYFKSTFKSSVDLTYVLLGILMLLVCLILPLGDIKNNVTRGIFIIFDTGLTVTTVTFLICIGIEVALRTESARKAKSHFEKIKGIEAERQTLIETLNKGIRAQLDKDDNNIPRNNKEFDLRGYIETFKDDKTED